MSNLPRYALAMVILLIAFVFFASVSCPPIAERDADTEEPAEYPLKADPGTTKELPGPLQIEDVFQREDIPDEQAFNNCIVFVRAADGQPLAGGSVKVFSSDQQRTNPLINGVTDEHGYLTIKWLPEGSYRFEVSHSVYFSSDDLTLNVPADTEQELEVILEIGARISGELRTPTGEPVRHGIVRFNNSEEQVGVTGKADAAGNFDSGPITPGLWNVEWAEHIHADAPQALRFDAALAPGNHRRLRFTMTGASATDVPAVGVTELLD